MRGDFYKQLTSNLETARAEGLFKEERIITSAQQADITVGDSHVINFCANNYLGLAHHPELIAAAKSGMDSHGFGMASVRFICGTQDTHKQLEKKLAGDWKIYRQDITRQNLLYQNLKVEKTVSAAFYRNGVLEEVKAAENC